jgi:hypothetical protein
MMRGGKRRLSKNLVNSIDLSSWRYLVYTESSAFIPSSYGDHWLSDTLSRMSLNDILSTIDADIARLQQARDLIASDGTHTRGKKPAKSRPARAKRTISAAGRQAIADAQRKRWAAQKKAAKTG